jgi:DNA-binding MarR family transcriptional regulator
MRYDGGMSTNLSAVQTEPESPGLSRHTGFLMARLGRAVTRQYRAALTPSGLKPREMPVLLALSEEGAMSQQALGTTLDMDASNLVVLLNELETARLISRRRDPDDRRRHLVEISARGRKLVCEVERAATRIDEEFFAVLDDDERLLLRDLLARVAQSAGVASRAPSGADDDGC